MADRYDPKEISSLANSVRKMLALDEPPEMSTAETVADIAAGFVPGVGTAQAARDFERARRSDDKLGMALAGVGAIPVVGGAVKPAKAAAKSLAEMAQKYTPDFSVVRVYEQPRTKNVYHATDADAPVISTNPERLIPNSLSTSNSPSRVWGKNVHKITIPKGARVGELRSVFDVLPSDVADTPMNIGKLLRKYAEDNSLDVLKINNVGGVGQEWAVLNPNFLPNAPKQVAQAPKEQKMLMGVYRGYAGERGDPTELFATPQKSIADYYARRRAAETGTAPHAEMLLVDPFVGQQYGLSIPIDKHNRDFNITRARKLTPDEVKSRTQLYAEGGAVADTDVKSWLAARPGATDYDIAAAMKKYDVAPEQVSRVTGVGLPEVQSRYAVARPKTDEEVKQFLTSQPGMTDPQIANAMRMYNVAPEQVSRAINMGLPEVKLRYAFASLPPPQPQPAPSGGRGDPMRDLNNIASAYSIGTYFIPGMQAAPLIDYGLRALSLGNTIKDIGKKLGFAAGGPVNYDPTEIDTIVSRVKEELHG